MKLQTGFLSSIVNRTGKVFLVSLGVSLATGAVQAQKEASNWIFGFGAGLNFSSSVPVPFSGAAIATNEGSAVISDQSGNLLFYTDGGKVWNKNHLLMPNGAGLLGHSSATQSAIIVPWPQSNCTKYFVFTVGAVADEFPDSLHFSVVDLSLPSGSGLGDVDAVSKNILLKTPVSEKLAAVSDSSGTGFWVLAHGFDLTNPGSSVNKEFYAYHVTASGINTTPVISPVGSAHEGATATPLYGSQGQMKVSPDGKLIASAVRSGFVEILNFSTLTGIVSGPANKFDTSAFKTKLFYGVEFSPNSKLLYVSTTEGSPNEVLQLDLATGGGTTLYTKTPTGTGSFYDTGELQMGPDKKIYVARFDKSFISVIDSPDTVGFGASFNPSGPALSTTAKSGLGLPTIIAGNFSCSSSCMQTFLSQVLCETDSFGKPTGNYTWQFRFQNLSGKPAYHLYLVDLPTGVTVDQDHFVFSPPVSGLSSPIKITFKGAKPGPLTFKLSIHDQTLDECCSLTVTLDLFPCDCAQMAGETLPGCFFPAPPPYRYSFNLQNLSPIKVENILLAAVSPVDHLTPIPTTQLTVNKDVLPVPALFTGGKTGTKSVFVSGPGAIPGKEICLRVGVHDKTLLDCCSIVRCFTLPDCTIRWDDHFSLGNAILVQLEPGFRIDNIGSSGGDGVGILLHGADTVALAWRNLDAQGPLPNGAFFEVSAAGTGGQGTGKVRVTQTGSQYQIAADIGGSPTYRVEVFKGDQPVGTVSGVSAINVIVIWPVAAGAEVTTSGLAFTLASDREIPWEFTGRPAVTGDRIRISPETSPVAVQSLERFELRAADIPSITVTGESVAFDCNANGVPDGGDIAAGTSVDFDRNGIPDECQTPGGDLNLSLNTGFNQATGVTLPPGGSDDDWRVINTSAPGPAKVVTHPVAAWPAPLARSGWISVDANRGRSVPGLDSLRFESCFCIGAAAATADLDLQLRADDSAIVFLNGVPIGEPGGSFRAASPLAIHLSDVVGGSGPFRAGENCLRVEVIDSGRGFTGLDLDGTVRAAQGACGARGAASVH